MELTTDEEIIVKRVREVQGQGYGRVEIIIQDRKVTNIIWAKSEFRNREPAQH